MWYASVVLAVALLSWRPLRARAGMFSAVARGSNAGGLETLFGSPVAVSQAQSLGEHPAAKAGLDSLFGAASADPSAATPPLPDQLEKNVDEAMGLGAAAADHASASSPRGGGRKPGGMSFLRDSEKKFMLSPNGVSAGFPRKADFDKGQPAVKYTMEIPDAPSPSSSSEGDMDQAFRGSSGSREENAMTAVQVMGSTSPSSQPKVVAEQRSWWERLKSGPGLRKMRLEIF